MVELDSEGELTRREVATFLREFADEIDDGTLDAPIDRGEGRDGLTDEGSVDARRVTLVVGGDSATVSVPETVEFDVEIDSRSPMLSSGVHQEIELELSWEVENPDERGDDGIEVK